MRMLPSVAGFHSGTIGPHEFDWTSIQSAFFPAHFTPAVVPCTATIGHVGHAPYSDDAARDAVIVPWPPSSRIGVPNPPRPAHSVRGFAEKVIPPTMRVPGNQ